MRQIRYTKKLDKLIQQGVSLREIRKRMKIGKKGQFLRVRNIIVGFVSAIVALTMFLFASPFIKEIVSGVTETIDSPLAVFVITALPYMILLLVFLLLVFALRGDSY